MLRIRPFAAVRPLPNLAARVASVPYDVVSTDEARAIAGDNPHSFLHVVRPEIDLPPETDIHDDAVYAKARENFDRLRAEGVLIQDETPQLYIYRQAWHHRTQIGVVACCHVDDYRRDIIKKHEHTRRDKEDDRTRHVLALDANAGPVFLTYRDRGDIDDLVRTDINHRPLYHFNADDGVTHTVWSVPDPAPYVKAFGQLPAAYVADGHHRSASAARAGAERRAAHPDHQGDQEYDWFLTVLFPASQLTILPYNRLVADLADLTPDAVRAALGVVGRLGPARAEPVEPARPGTFGVYLDGAWHELVLDPASIDASDPIGSLDVSLLQDRVLAPILRIGDPRSDARIGFVGGIRGPGALRERVDAGDAAIGFTLHPTSIDQLLSVADAGKVMPPKSTWFEPKLRSGLLVHLLS